MKRLLVDISHILKAILHVADGMDTATYVEFEGKEVKIPDPHEGYEIFLKSYKKTLADLGMTPCQTILVKDGKGCKAKRREFYPGYCDRPKGAPEWMESFLKAQELVVDTITKYGGLAVVKDGEEADDIIAALAATMDSIIWSGDGDLLAAGDVYYKGGINVMGPEMLDIDKKHIVVYKSLVGDKSDKLPGCKNFGYKTLMKMMIKYGDDSLDDMLDMLEKETLDELEDYQEDFLGFKKILAHKDEVYASYKCAKFYHPGWDLEWEAQYPCGNGHLPEWEPTQELITADKITKEFLREIENLLWSSHHVALDIESYTTPEGKDWEERNRSSNGKKPLDVFGSILAGFSFTSGRNNHKSFYFPVDHADTNNLSMDQAEVILNMLPDTEDIPIVIQNTAFEYCVLRNHFELKFDRGYLPVSYDTKIMAGYVDEYDLSGLKHNAKKRLGYNQVTYEEVLGGKSGMNELTGVEVTSYGIDDVITTSSLYSQYRVIMDYEDTWNAYAKADLIPQHLYAESYLTGVKFDFEKLNELREINRKKYEGHYRNIQDFLIKLSWDEEVEVEKPKAKRVTIADLSTLKTGKKKAETEYKTIKHRWDGCVFIPAKELTPAEIKRLYLTHTGQQLKCKVRNLDKIADVIEGLGESSFADCVRDESLGCVNTIVKESFQPMPEINLNSPKQMSRLIYDALKLPVRILNELTTAQRKKGQRKGNPSTDKDAIAHAIIYDCEGREGLKEFLEEVLAANRCLTEESLFYSSYVELPNPADGYIHPEGGQGKTKSGRPASAKPNFSQVSGVDKSRVREVYVPLEDDHVWVSFDVSGQELMITAVNSQCPDMLSCYTGEVRKDIHSMTGTYIFNTRNEADIDYDKFLATKDDKGNPLSEEAKKCRKLAKPVNFLDLYMGTNKTLAVDLRIKEDVAQQFLDAKGKAFPGVRQWQEDQTEVHRKLGYAKTAFGKRRHLPLDGTWRDNHELRGALNMIIQGSAAEQLKCIMREVWERRVLEIFDAYFLFSVYDELNFSVKKSETLEFIKMVHPLMVQPFSDYDIDFKSSIEIGRSFGELVEIGEEIDEEKILRVLEEL